MPSKRSPSPLSSRPNPPHCRNMESNSTMRRSFSGGNPFHRPSMLTHSKSFNPVTPANSPAGFGRRNSVGKEGMGQLLSPSDEKENEKDQILKSVKVRSPSNGTKNFMSPTISAASKFTPSPRKKPLVERKEQVRTSISLSDGKATFFSAISSDNTEDLVPKSEEKKVEKGCLDSSVSSHLNENEAVLECPPVSKVMKKVTFAEQPSGLSSSTSSDTVIIDSDCFDVENNNLQNITSSFSVSPVIAPLDADPSVPPYDPKRNYLSPRPQFLHYKPNPRIELLLQKKEKVFDSEVKCLDDSFILESSSETCSDTDGAEESNSSAEIVEPEVKEEEEEEGSLCDKSDISAPISYESNSSAEIVEPEVNEEEEKEGSLCDKSDISAPISYETTEEKTVAGKRSFFTSMKFASLLLVFLIGVISISVPAMNSSILKNSNFSELHLPPGVADMAKANFDAYTRRFKKLSFDSIYQLSFMVKNLSGHDSLSSPQFINLTDVQNDDVSVGWKTHTSPVFGEIYSHGVCENAIGGKGAEKFTGDLEKQDVEVPEDGESLPSEEDDTTYLESDDASETYISAPEIQMEESETYVEVVSDDTRETEMDGEIDKGNQEFTFTAEQPVQQMEESDDNHETGIDGEMDMGNQEFTFTAEQPVQQMEESEEVVSDDTHETGIDGEIDMGNQELTSSPAPIQQIEEFETHVEFDDTLQTGIDGKIDLGNQELTSPPIPDHQIQESPVNFQTVWGQEVEGGLESVNEEKISEIQPELLENTKLEAAAPLEMIKSPIVASVIVLLLTLISAAAAYVYLNRASTNSSTTSTSNQDSVVPNDQFLLSNKKIMPETTWTREVMMEGEEEESCSSEMSSFQTKPSFSSYNHSSSSHSRLLKTANDEADQESQERRRNLRKQSKRESLASSSSSEFSKSCSPSYGSFTTYEKITCKNATSGEDEIMTPVRRSSRIRNLSTSP